MVARILRQPGIFLDANFRAWHQLLRKHPTRPVSDIWHPTWKKNNTHRTIHQRFLPPGTTAVHWNFDPTQQRICGLSTGVRTSSSYPPTAAPIPSSRMRTIAALIRRRFQKPLPTILWLTGLFAQSTMFSPLSGCWTSMPSFYSWVWTMPARQRFSIC